MEGRLLEESGWYCGSSDGRGSSERRRTRSEVGRVLGGSASYELRLEVFYTQHSAKVVLVRVDLFLIINFLSVKSGWYYGSSDG